MNLGDSCENDTDRTDDVEQDHGSPGGTFLSEFLAQSVNIDSKSCFDRSYVPFANVKVGSLVHGLYELAVIKGCIDITHSLAS